MRFGFARVFQKTNSFARRMTGIGDFRRNEWLEGAAISELWAGTNTVAGGVLEESDNSEAQVIPLLSTSAQAGGAVSTQCLDQLSQQLIASAQGVPEKLDGLILELSGTLVTDLGSSGDEFLLQRIRRAFTGLPVVLAVSGQANLTESLANESSAIVAPWHVPAVDASEQGQRTVQTLVRICQCDQDIATSFQRLPLLVPVAAQRTSRQPMNDILRESSEASIGDGILSVAFLCGYPFADASHSGSSIVVTSSDRIEKAREIANKLSQEVWKRRDEFYVEGSNVEEAVHHAMASREGPVMIADLGDNPDDGAPGDGTTALWALLDLGVRNATVGALADEQAVEACVRAGVGARVEIPVGGRRDTRHGYPIDISGIVVSIHDGAFRLNGPVSTGLQVDAGRIVLLNLDARHEGHVELILTEKPIQITDSSLFEHIGIDLTSRQIISIKSVNDYRPAFEPIARQIFEIITPGITTPDPAFFAYQRVPRPIFPLDQIEE